MRLYAIRILFARIWMTSCSSRSQPVGLAILSLQVVCDLAITASMVYYLYTQRSVVKRCVNLLPECGIRSHRVITDHGRRAQDSLCAYDSRTLLDY